MLELEKLRVWISGIGPRSRIYGSRKSQHSDLLYFSGADQAMVWILVENAFASGNLDAAKIFAESKQTPILVSARTSSPERFFSGLKRT